MTLTRNQLITHFTNKELSELEFSIILEDSKLNYADQQEALISFYYGDLVSFEELLDYYY